MKAFALVLAATLVAGASVSASPVPAVDILPGIIGIDRDWMNMPVAFDAQPTWSGTAPVSASNTETATIGAYSNRWAVIDLGSGYADMRITQTWTRYMNWTGGNCNLFQEYGWANSWDTWNIPVL